MHACDKLNELNEILPKIQEKKNKLEQNIQKVLNDMHIIDEIKGILERIG